MSIFRKRSIAALTHYRGPLAGALARALEAAAEGCDEGFKFWEMGHRCFVRLAVTLCHFIRDQANTGNVL